MQVEFQTQQADTLKLQLAAKKKELQGRQEELDAVWTISTHEHDRRVALQQQNAALQQENAALRRALGPTAAADAVMEMVAEAVEAAEPDETATTGEPPWRMPPGWPPSAESSRP